MKKDFIYIRICDGMNLSKTKIILKDKCNKIVYEEIIVNLNNIKIPIYNNDIYKLFIISGLKIIVIPLIAKRDEIYCININNNFNKNHLITVLLEDANNSNIKIKRGEILLWEDTLLLAYLLNLLVYRH
jgi:hypothetical protein